MLKPAPTSAASRPKAMPVAEKPLPATPTSDAVIFCEASRNSWFQPRRSSGMSVPFAVAMREVRRTPSVVWKEFAIRRIHGKRAEAARLAEALKMRVHVIERRVRRDGDIHARGRNAPMIASLRMALIALARGRGGRVARKPEGREQARGAELVEAHDGASQACTTARRPIPRKRAP